MDLNPLKTWNQLGQSVVIIYSVSICHIQNLKGSCQFCGFCETETESFFLWSEKAWCKKSLKARER